MKEEQRNILDNNFQQLVDSLLGPNLFDNHESASQMNPSDNLMRTLEIEH